MGQIVFYYYPRQIGRSEFRRKILAREKMRLKIRKLYESKGYEFASKTTSPGPTMAFNRPGIPLYGHFGINNSKTD